MREVFNSGKIVGGSPEAYSIFIPLVPVAKARPRLGRHGTFTPAKSKNAEAEIRYWLANSGCRMIEGPLRLDVVFHMPRPKSLKKGTVWHTKRPDADNLAKQVMDAGNGFLWSDDAAICDLRISKVYAIERPGISLSISKII